MKKLELEPSEENLIKTFEGNILKRNIKISYFLDLLNNIHDSCTIAVDGRWGCGKTFFVKQVKLILDACNPDSDLPEDIRARVRNIAKNWIKMDGDSSELMPQTTVYYDAWENDNNIDPMASLIYNISGSYAHFENQYEKIKETACSIIKVLSATYLGFQLPIDKLVEIFQSSNPLEFQKIGYELRQKTKNFLDTIFVEQGNRCVIFIDELDRCRPDFAVQLLERIKHYFNNEHITFVFSVNTEELMNTINRYYGEHFDSGRYLNRFFDLKVRIPTTNIEPYLEHCGIIGESKFKACIKMVILILHFELREINRFITICNIIKNKIQNIYNMSVYCNRDALAIGFNYVFPLMIGLSIKNSQEYESFTQGKNPELLVEVITGIRRQYDLGLDKTLGYNPSSDQEINEVIKKFYHAIFDLDNKDSEITIGKISINEELRKKIFDVSSLLSFFSDFS